jgi:modification methylase
MPHHPDHAQTPDHQSPEQPATVDQTGDHAGGRRRHPEQHADRGPVPLSVWACAQRPAASQRKGRYLSTSTSHPAKMLPEVAATAITAYTQPGDLVLDPMCGIGTTLVEAVHLGRDAVGIECEPRWSALARANLDHARTHGASGTGGVITGDARNAHALVTDEHLAGKVALLLTSPPYGHSTHGQVRSSRDSGSRGIRKWDHGYGTNPDNLARGSHDRLIFGFTDILAGCLPLLRPGGIVAITTRPFRRAGQLIDFPTQVFEAAQDAGLQPVQRLVALLCGIKDDRLVTRASFFAMHEVRKARAAGLPLHVVAHEDVLVLRKNPGQDDTRANQNGAVQ